MPGFHLTLTFYFDNAKFNGMKPLMDRISGSSSGLTPNV